MFDYQKYAQNYDNRKDFDRYLLDFKFAMLREWKKDLGDCLELGCATGLMTEMLLPFCRKLDIVDASKEYIELVRRKLKGAYPERAPDINFYNCFFEEYKPQKRYDVIILAGVLPAIDNPEQFLRHISGWFKEGGFVFITSHNAYSLHRRLGKIMGLIKDEHELSERDKKLFNHKKVYDLESLTGDVRKAGLRILKSGGVFLKPFPNAKMMEFDEKYINAFFEISKQVDPNLLAELYIFAGK